MFNIGTHSSCKLRMKEEDSELSHDIAENTQVCLSVLLISIYIYILFYYFFFLNKFLVHVCWTSYAHFNIKQDALSCTGLALSNFILTIFFVASF